MAQLKVDYINSMGDDVTVVNAARVSFDKNKIGIKCDYRDKKLIRYLAKHKHWTPFAHVMITLRETVPIFVARQRFKHQIGFVYNEISRRYVSDEPEFFMPDVWRGKPVNAKQGSSDTEVVTLNKHEPIDTAYNLIIDESITLYNDMINANVAPEMARMVLPQSMMTSYYVTGSLYAFANAYNLRSDYHAQSEIRDLATLWDKHIKNIAPISWGALTHGQKT